MTYVRSAHLNIPLETRLIMGLVLLNLETCTQDWNIKDALSLKWWLIKMPISMQRVLDLTLLMMTMENNSRFNKLYRLMLVLISFPNKSCSLAMTNGFVASARTTVTPIRSLIFLRHLRFWWFSLRDLLKKEMLATQINQAFSI